VLDPPPEARSQVEMSTGNLTINLKGISNNWTALDQLSAINVETAAVVKADGYGLDAARVAHALYHAGVRQFFVAAAEEAAAIRMELTDDVNIFVFSGHMRGDTEIIHDLNLIPLLNSFTQLTRHVETLPGHPFGIQLDTGMNRLGMELLEWEAVREMVLTLKPELVISHLACADQPDHPMNKKQLKIFQSMTDGLNLKRSLSATGGILLGPEYHFDMTRPGIGLYGGAPFSDAGQVVQLSLPIIQIRDVEIGETVGYGCTWQAEVPSRIATVAAGYADGLMRSISPNGSLWAGDNICKIVGRISMDMVGVDITNLDYEPNDLEIIGKHQNIDDLAGMAGTIGYEILTSLGSRYNRRYVSK
jgi:alanine racemase|tara:strand:+ start:30 stop:1112 length:1083 start_codon:yes stop_codon:yes gene_type:complete